MNWIVDIFDWIVKIAIIPKSCHGGSIITTIIIAAYQQSMFGEPGGKFSGQFQRVEKIVLIVVTVRVLSKKCAAETAVLGTYTRPIHTGHCQGIIFEIKTVP